MADMGKTDTVPRWKPLNTFLSYGAIKPVSSQKYMLWALLLGGSKDLPETGFWSYPCVGNSV